ncbi:hypothetical protein DFQ27_004905 [Actinomortierella ambigua]|uniref:Uncharacterized protein n=1 Tax=Actinomortierella ambigua TaxID=1343610 RepID=A0A9P6Q0A9_9FUNG|nr:hypothetical protein DFQ27_004905 [Actinomortierella ambigua]
MARMPMPRDRAAPMDWERENTTNFPNVLDSSESTGFDAAGPQHDSPMNGRSSTFGQRGTSSTKASGTIPLNKGSEDPAQSKPGCLVCF